VVEGCVEGRAAGCCAEGCVEGLAAGCVDGFAAGWVEGRVEGCVEGLAVALLFLELFPLLMLLDRSTFTLTLLVTLRVGALILVGAR
jgi:hypothetical protein